MHFRYPKKIGFTLEDALSIEWLETNGLGGYASSTAINCHTRKYHGLLVSKLDGLPDKYVLLNKVEDLFIHDAHEYVLAAHSYPNFMQDEGYSYLEEFIVTTHPQWRFKLPRADVIRELLMLDQEDTVLFKYSSDNCDGKISLRPLFACRNFHELAKENHFLRAAVEILPDGFGFAPYQGLPKIFWQTNGKFNFLPQPLWYRNFLYCKEKERGYDYAEDLFSPGVMVIDLQQEQGIICSCSTGRQKNNLTLRWLNELDRRNKKQLPVASDELQAQLHQAGQSFITSNANKKNQSIVAGYHWFLEWGRDAMIALPGLTLYSGQENICLAILKNFALQESQGLIPNFLGVVKESNAYNTVDASLWFAWAVQQYYLRTSNYKEVITYFWPTLKNIFKHYQKGTQYRIKMQEEGLLYAGTPDINLTWMDAAVDGFPVTPRYGYQVEVNALWFNLLGFMAELAAIMKDPLLMELRKLLPLVQNSFRETFWCEEKGYLYDFVNAKEQNSQLRPNQIFAVSLPYSPLLIQTAVRVVATVKAQLLTPFGLRTLAKSEPGYVGHYTGNQRERDFAYHNGTVWPWLLGHFTEALLKVTSDRRKVVTIMGPCLQALQKHLTVYGIGSIAEFFSGDPPYVPDGCISQAWSVAEVLRLTYLLNHK